MADTGVGIRVPVTTPVSKALPVPAMGVASAAGVAKAAAAGQVVYNVTGGPNQSSGGGALQGGANNKAEPEFGNKIDYLFGKAKGNQHNLERTNGMKNELEIKMEITDNYDNRSYIMQKLKESYYDNNSIANIEQMSYIAKEIPGKPKVYWTGVTRETFIMGPDRGAVFQTLWDDNVLKNIIIKGGKGVRPESIDEILSQINRRK